MKFNFEFTKKLNKRLIAYLLAIIIVVSAIPLLNAVTTEKSVNIYDENDILTNEVMISETTGTTVKAVPSFRDEISYTWQIFINKIWVDIYGKTENELHINYSMVKDVLNISDSALIRCKVVTSDKQDTVFSDILSVKFLPAIDEDLFPETTSKALNAKKSSLKSAAPLSSPQTVDETQAGLVYHTITVKYIYEIENDEHLNGTSAYQSYVATIADGDNFTLNTVCPIIKGFTSWVKYEDDDDFTKATEIKKSFVKITDNHVVLVHYRPAETTYDVRFYFQNTNNDEYTENVSLRTKYTGITFNYTDNDKIVNDYADKTKGFRYVPTEQLQIAGDGSTELRLYYDREYYLVFFELNDGGYGTEAVYAKYDSSVHVPDPKRPGYVFNGWASSMGAKTPDVYVEVSTEDYYSMKVPIPKIIQSETVASTTYYAVWTTTNAEYAVIYWLENAEDYGYSYGGSIKAKGLSGTYVSADSVPAYSGENSKHFVRFDARSDSAKMIEGDGSTVVNVYYNRVTYKLTFKAKNKSYSGHTHDALTKTATNNFTVKETANGCYFQDCGKTEHVHTSACKACDLEEHLHTDSCCPIPAHTHSASCYSAPSATYRRNQNTLTVSLDLENPLLTPPDGASNNGNVYRVQNSYYSYTYYLYINGNDSRSPYKNGYYRITGTSAGNVYSSTQVTISPSVLTCTVTEHSHSNSCNTTCGKTMHLHTQSCYSCNIPAHTHTADCYRCKCLYDTKADSSRDGNNYGTLAVYNFKFGQRTGYGAAHDQWFSSDYLWANDPNVRQVYSNPPQLDSDLVVYGLTPDNTEVVIHYKENGTNKQILEDFIVRLQMTSGITDEDEVDLVGFKYNKVETVSRLKEYTLWYDRKSYSITYLDGYGGTVKTYENVPFEADMTSYFNFALPANYYPATLEKGVYRFGGWYMDESCDESTRFSPDNPNAPKTMPAYDGTNGLVLFAKWIPVTHSVKFYTDADFDTLITKDGFGDFTQPDPVSHRGYITSIPQNISQSGYLLSGWFYYENNEKIAFDPYNMPVTKDLNLYPEWQSTQFVSFEIHYELEDGTPIAKPLTGNMLAGNSRMFYAKGEQDWYEDYRDSTDNFFPLEGTHNMIMSTDSSENIYTFVYIDLDEVSYSVKFINAVTKETMLDKDGKSLDYTATTVNSIIDVIPEKFPGYLPDAFSKRAYLSTDASKNVIVFEYTENTTQAYYRVSYQYQDADDDNYVEMRYIDYLGDIGATIDIEKLKAEGLYEGFEYDAANSDVSKTVVEQEGIIIILSYKRVLCGYTVYHRLVDSTTDLVTPQTGKARYGATVTVSADSTIKNVKPAGALTSSITISIDPTKNVYTFYYSEDQAEIVYLRAVYDYSDELYNTVDADNLTFNGCILSSSQDIVDSINGTPAGSTVSGISKKYQFNGWYVVDETNGNITVNDGEKSYKVRKVNTSTDNVTLTNDGKTLTPEKDDGYFNDATYFALMQPITTELNITRDDLDGGDEIIYHVKGKSDFNDDEVDIYVTVNADNPSVKITDLPIGDYTVTEEKDWSWRFTDGNEKTDKVTPASNEMEFDGKKSITTWLSEVLNKVNTFISKS